MHNTSKLANYSIFVSYNKYGQGRGDQKLGIFQLGTKCCALHAKSEFIKKTTYNSSDFFQPIVSFGDSCLGYFSCDQLSSFQKCDT